MAIIRSAPAGGSRRQRLLERGEHVVGSRRAQRRGVVVAGRDADDADPGAVCRLDVDRGVADRETAIAGELAAEAASARSSDLRATSTRSSASEP